MGAERKKKVDKPTESTPPKPSGSTNDPKASSASTGSGSQSGSTTGTDSGSNEPKESSTVAATTIEETPKKEMTKAETMASDTQGKAEMGGTTSMKDAEENSDDSEEPNYDGQGRINPEQQADVEEGGDLNVLPGEEVDEPIKERNRLQLYNPSSMLSWGQFEAKFFSQLYTQTQFFDPDGERMEQGNRTNYYSGIGNVVFGYNNRLNFGFDFWLQSVFIDTASGSPLRLFSGNRAPWGRTALTAIGPKVKWQPFAKANNFTIQSSLLLPVAKDPEGRENGRPFLATQNFLWWTQVFYTNNFHSKFQLFMELDFYWNIDRAFNFSQSGFIAMPASVFLSYFPTSKVTLYVNTQFWPTLGEGVVSSWWYQAGFGGKYQLSKSIDLEASVGKFLAGRGAAGPATTYNFGIRFVKW